MIWQPEFTDKTLSRKPGAVQPATHNFPDPVMYIPSGLVGYGLSALRTVFPLPLPELNYCLHLL